MKLFHKMISSIFIGALLAACSTGTATDSSFLLYGDSSSNSSSSSSSDKETDSVTTATGSEFTAANTIYIKLSDLTVSSDNLSWSQISTTAASFFDKTVKVKLLDDDSGVSTGVIRINATDVTDNLSIHLEGTLSEGGIKIQTSTEYETGIYLDGVTINSTNYPCIDITKGGAATVFLKGTNTLVDGRIYGIGYGEEYSTSSGDTYTDDGVTYSCTVSQSVEKEGSDSKGTLFCKGGLTICDSGNGDGKLYITQAYKNCIASKDGYLTIESGTYNLTNYTSSTNTGKNALYGAKGITVNGGSITFDGKGIISTSDFRKADAFKTDDDDYPSSFVKITGGTINVTTYNGKGICAPYVYISGGTNTFNVTGITTYAENSKTGSYYDADGVYQSNQTIKFAAEGIEGESLVEISGGTTTVSAVDDGINVSTTGGSLNISGGFLYVSSKGDGLDSNGNITVTGGVTVVSQTGGSNSPIDCGDGNYKFTVTGSSATVFAMGASDMFSESKPSSTTIPYICSTSLGSSSSSLGVNTSSGTNLVFLESPQTYAAAIFISDELTSGSSYKFVKGGSASGTEYVEGTGFYLPASSVSGGSSTSATATTASSSSSSFGPGGR